MTEQNYEAMRQAMVMSQLRTNGVNDVRLLAAMKAVPRERFVPADRRASAYVDVAIPLGGGRAMAAPLVIGRLLTEAGVSAEDKVLLIGAGLGYSAAVVAGLAASVVAVEEDAGLAKAAGEALAGQANVELVQDALTKGAVAQGPYDLLFIEGAVEFVPDALLAHMKDGSRIATGLVEDGVTRLAIGRKAGQGVGFARFADAEIPTLPGFAKPRTFSF